ncbi:MAG: DeoR/GlpR transcriptional regulator [Oscillospiraceae bacterium]|nr:DeoR/GlpR transcriptional regulator [Oscillospiraceae bacterium]
MYEIRKQQIMKLLEQRDHISVKEIKECMDVSAMTVQRDLTKMEQEGLIIKGFGEISKVKGIYLERLMLSQENDIPENQDKIAYHAASLVEDGDTIFLSSGNIIFNLAKRIKHRQIIAVTPSIRAALALSKGKGIVYMTGGMIAKDGINLGGEYAENTIQKFYADKAFITCASINSHGEMCDYSETEVRMKRLLMEHTKHIYLLIEADKFGMSKFYRSEHLSQVTAIITDRQPPAHALTLIEKLGIQLTVLES